MERFVAYPFRVMPNEEAKSFLEQATTAVHSGQYEQALDLVERCLTLDPDNYEALLVRGIALSQTNQPEVATETFRRAIRIQPATAKGHYNLAVNLYGLGRKDQALEAVKKSLELDPSHESSHSLRQTLERDLGLLASPRVVKEAGDKVAEGGDLSQYRPSNAWGDENYREGYDSDPNDIHSIPFVQKLGQNWFWIGVVLAILPLVWMGIEIALAPQALRDAMAGRQPSQSGMAGMSTVSMVMLAVRSLTALLGLGWMILDILDRRVSLVWLIPFTVCCCLTIGCLPGVVLGIYLAAGRKG